VVWQLEMNVRLNRLAVGGIWHKLSKYTIQISYFGSHLDWKYLWYENLNSGTEKHTFEVIQVFTIENVLYYVNKLYEKF
jgi:hypothetical protein